MKDSKRNRANAKRTKKTATVSKYAAKQGHNARALEAWVNHNNTVLAHRAIEEERDHEEWLDENFGNECLNCGGPLGHSHTC